MGIDGSLSPEPCHQRAGRAAPDLPLSPHRLARAGLPSDELKQRLVGILRQIQGDLTELLPLAGL